MAHSIFDPGCGGKDDRHVNLGSYVYRHSNTFDGNFLNADD